MSPLWLSFEVAASATVIAGLLGVALAARLAHARSAIKEWVDVLVTAPMVLPPTVLGYYLLNALGRASWFGARYEALTGGSIAFSRTGAIVAATVAAFPFVLKSARVAFEEIDPRLLAAAGSLGARPLEVLLRVELPVAQRGIAAGLALGFARSLGEFGITLMLAGNLPGETQTGALAVYDAVQAGRDADALRDALILSALAIGILYLVNRLTRRRPHDF